MSEARAVRIGNFSVGGGHPLAFIAGPCVVESREMLLRVAERLKRISRDAPAPFILKASYRKANRTSASGFTGIGAEEALRCLEEAGREFDLPVLTDVHTPEEVPAAASVASVLQIPAFLSRQTDLLRAAGESGRAVNIKKGQFLAPGDMRHAAEKVAATGNTRILLCERGTTFGYHNLVVDMRGLAIMREIGYPVVYDATHSLQLPGASDVSGGEPHFALPLARAAAAVGVDAVFFETHPDPSRAMSDAATQLPLDDAERFVREVLAVDRAIRGLAEGSR